MGKNHKARGIVESLVTLSKRMQITTVAEGVETAEQEEFLREIGCDLMQGYYFAKPLAPEDWLKYLASANSKVRRPVN